MRHGFKGYLIKQDASGYWHAYRPTGGLVGSFCFKRDAVNAASEDNEARGGKHALITIEKI